MKQSLSLALALLAATPPPTALAAEALSMPSLALAADDLSAYRRPGPDPDVAANLSLWVPLGLTVLTLPVTGPLSMFVGGLATGAGHFYAGEPARGTLVSLGGVVVPTLGIGLGVGIGLGLANSSSGTSGLGVMATAGIVTGLVSTLGYLIFASQDAYHTAERQQSF